VSISGWGIGVNGLVVWRSALRRAFAITTAAYGRKTAPKTNNQRHGEGVRTASTKQTIRIDIIHA
jgi:hypothetical protein